MVNLQSNNSMFKSSCCKDAKIKMALTLDRMITGPPGLVLVSANRDIVQSQAATYLESSSEPSGTNAA